uniref:heterogeneous nuclear ribonucleoprotein A/B isoform X1 n=1 Tax=Ciona intestinalis TaxID=7719 RepID=UPI000521A73A|nr:heterogeneous nuclear ribonucleoprotein A/B isoform X1 [Ciona intestinalis]|eukprot:XP_009860507.1 heterogeneous nuclear ribonucleoprotein A/B isoform X1 [Ciona intestinalis]
MAENGNDDPMQQTIEAEPEQEPQQSGEAEQSTEAATDEAVAAQEPDAVKEEPSTEPEIKEEATAEAAAENGTDGECAQAAEQVNEENTEGGEGDADDKEKHEEEGSLINATEDNELKMFVGGLSWDTETVGLREYFSKFGVVKDCTIKKDSKTERSRGFGFVLFDDAETVKKVLESENHYLDGRKIDPKKAQAQRRDGKLFVGGINPDTENDVVKEYFTQYGEIEEFERPVDKNTGKNRGFCFITYKKDGCIKLATASKTQELEGSKIDVKEAQPQVERSGRGGGRGGFGMGRGGWGGHGGYGGGKMVHFNVELVPFLTIYFALQVMGMVVGWVTTGMGLTVVMEDIMGQGGMVIMADFIRGVTAEGRGGSGRHREGEWDTRTPSNHTSWYGSRGHFHGAYQGFHNY